MDHRRFILLDGLRGVAAFAVLLFHQRFMAEGGHLLDKAYLAVDFFFMLSGFVMALAYQDRVQKGLSFAKFMKIRLIRLYPLYLLGLLAGVVVWGLKSHLKGYPAGDVLLPCLSMAAFLPAFVALRVKPDDAYPLNSPAWSLSFEMAANLAFFFLVRKRGVVLPLLMCVGMGTWLIMAGEPLGGYNYTNWLNGVPRVGFSFSMGLLLYSLYKRIASTPNNSTVQSGLMFVLLAGGVLAIFAPHHTHENTINTDLLAIGGVFPLIILAGAMFEVQGRVKKGVELLGDLSYPLYILHYPLMMLIQGALKNHPAWVLPVSVITIGGSAYLALRLYDIPVRKHIQAWLNQGRASA